MFIPLKRRKNCAPWITGEIIHAIHLKESCRKKMKKNAKEHYVRFKELRSRVKKLVVDAKTKFFSSLGQDLKTNPKRMWSVLKFSSTKANIPNVMSSQSVLAGAPRIVGSNPSSIAHLFNKHFVSIFHIDGDENNVPSCSSPAILDYFNDIELSVAHVQQRLSMLDVNKATGPDGIPNRVLKEQLLRLHSRCV